MVLLGELYQYCLKTQFRPVDIRVFWVFFLNYRLSNVGAKILYKTIKFIRYKSESSIQQLVNYD